MINEKYNPVLKIERKVTRMSIFINSSWRFVDPNAYTFYPVDDFSRIALIRTRFGVLYNDENDPSKLYRVGEENDYLIMDYDANLSIMTKDTYNKIYKK